MRVRRGWLGYNSPGCLQNSFGGEAGFSVRHTMRDEPQVDLATLLEEHADCDYTKRVPSGLEEIDPARIADITSKAEKPVVIKFGKDFCGWTKKLNRALQVYVPPYAEHAEFYEVNIPTHQHVVDEWNLDTSPIMVLIKDGQEVDRTDAAEAHEVPPVFEKWFGPLQNGEG